MKKKIYIDKLKEKYSNKISIIESDRYEKKLSDRIILSFKTVGLIFLLLFGSVIPVVIFNLDFSSSALILKLVYSTICDIVILGILIFIYRKTLINDFKNFFNRNIFNNLELAFKYWFVGFLIMVISNLIISAITSGGIASNEESVRQLIDLAPIYMLFNVAIYAPLTEELIFRKSIRDIFKNKYIYIIVSGLVFGGLHVVSSLADIQGLLYLIPYGALGISFAALYNKSDNIFSSICMHSMHNTMAIILYILL